MLGPLTPSPDGYIVIGDVRWGAMLFGAAVSISVLFVLCVPPSATALITRAQRVLLYSLNARFYSILGKILLCV